MKSVIGYTRVSTLAQGTSGLGIEGQHEAIRQFCESNGYLLERIETEIASGGLDETGRPVLAKSLRDAKAQGHTVLVAKLCRLSRDHFFIKRMSRDLKVDFQCVESPNMSGLELGIRAEFDEEYRTRISINTRAALAAKRARGEPLGNLENLRKHGHKGCKTQKDSAISRVERLRFALTEVTELSLSEAARVLNRRCVETPTKRGQWNHKMVSRAMTRLELV